MLMVVVMKITLQDSLDFNHLNYIFQIRCNFHTLTYWTSFLAPGRLIDWLIDWLIECPLTENKGTKLFKCAKAELLLAATTRLHQRDIDMLW